MKYKWFSENFRTFQNHIVLTRLNVKKIPMSNCSKDQIISGFDSLTSLFVIDPCT